MTVTITRPPPGTRYEVAAWQRKAYREGGHHWYCPQGHHITYNESEIDRLKRRAEWAEQRLVAERDLREHTEHKLRAQKGATTKARKRHAAGVCPVCSRSFQQVRRHMASQHPDYDPAKGNE